MGAKVYNGQEDVLAKIKTYREDFRSDAEAIHEIIMSAVQNIYPRLWYGMPGYARSKSGPVLIYFRKDKYITFGRTESSDIAFNELGEPIPAAWFISSLNDASKKMISGLALEVLR